VGSQPKGFGSSLAVPVPDGFLGAEAVLLGFFGRVAVPDGFLEAGAVPMVDLEGFGLALAGSVPFFPPALGAGQPGRSAGVVAFGGSGFAVFDLAAEGFALLAEAFITLAEGFVSLAGALVTLALAEDDEVEVALGRS
jgi:hypothetical protein